MAWYFDGVDDIIEIGTTSQNIITSSIQAWSLFQWTQWQGSGDGNDHTSYWDRGSSSVDTLAGGWLWINETVTGPTANDEWTWQIAASDNTNFSVRAGDATALNNTWQSHVCLVDWSGNMEYYLDGSSAGTTAISAKTGGDHVRQPTFGAFKAAGASPNEDDRLFKGRIAETALWDAVLTSDEAAALDKGFSPLLIRPSNLLFYWPGHAGKEEKITANAQTTESAPVYAAEHAPMINPPGNW